jgi:hypothetical protein
VVVIMTVMSVIVAQWLCLLPLPHPHSLTRTACSSKKMETDPTCTLTSTLTHTIAHALPHTHIHTHIPLLTHTLTHTMNIVRRSTL